jgi:hypothetical protein
LDGESPSAFSSKIICRGNIPKSEFLMAFLAHTNITPDKIMFIDDKIQKCEDVKEQCNLQNIKFLGIKYMEAPTLSPTPFCVSIIECGLSIRRRNNISVSNVDI